MFAKVRLLNGWNERLLYAIPQELSDKITAGALVTVPLQKRSEIGYVESLFPKVPAEITYSMRAIINYDSFLNNESYRKFIQQLAGYYGIESVTIYKRFCTFLKEKHEEISHSASQETNQPVNTLTHEQQAAFDGIEPYLIDQKHQTFVIHGVTGSGKTEIYHHLIAKNNSLNRTTILLLPEVSLAVQFTELFKKRFTSWPVFGFHSGTGVPEKKVLWSHLRNDKPALIIGVHLPVILPLSTLGLIIIDEEHDVGYQEKKHPKINTKEAALIRAQTFNIPIVLGSATPSLTTLYNVHHRGWKMFTVTKRFAGAFPEVQVIQLTSKQKRQHFWISKELESAIKDRLAKKEQIIIFLNRRGYSFFVQCSSCGFIFRCGACSVSLTLHEHEYLCCHYCGFTEPLNKNCISCQSNDLIKKGIGTQQVVSILERMFPEAKIGRADHDTTVNKKKWHSTVNAFSAKELDILVGTQTITKGYHFPHVTLVGVLWADINLGMPTYNAVEVTLQQLIQVAGRAGRQHPESLVIIQTMLMHDILRYVNETTYPAFYDSEIKKRAEINYPPLVRFAEIEFRNSNNEIIEHESQECAAFLCDHIIKESIPVILLGPAEPPVHKIKNVYIRKMYIKGASMKDLLAIYSLMRKMNLKSSISFTPNPLS